MMTEIEICSETLEDVPSNDVYDGSDVDEYIIDYLIEHTRIENIAFKIKSGSVLGNILEDLLKSVRQPRGSLHDDWKEHFKLVNKAWEDNQLISLILEEKNVKHLKYMIQKYSVESNQQLCESLTPLIKNHLPIKNMLLEGQISSVRGALTILIRYFSARNNVLGFADLVGRGGAVGIYTARYSDSQDDDMKIEPISKSAGGAFVETSSSCTLEELMPDTSLIDQLLNDATLKESPTNLPDIFKRLSDGAQMLRLKERLDRIRGASFWKTNDFDESDFALKMRLALSILIGYWSARDVSKLVMHLLHYQIKNPTKAHLLEDLRDVEVICYFVDSNHDLEGLKNVLAIKYAKDSPEFTSRFVEIERHHQKLKVRKAAEALITAILKNKNCIMIY
ncbi:hypothetical protein CASFOL_005252 [Castilleja foliolosa]|uniref:Uncharacterized protein n=1 Tax=Castilleja foliolosa TaxID=1961234 RepID=A0ABD3E6X3_9LAMI